MLRPKLTIAIPTYNRAKKLKMCIEQITKQIENKTVEILVSDNNSTDGTKKLMDEMVQKYNISYYRNDTNVGPDKNFLLGYERARGEYVMLLGDDDILLPGAIDSILESLEKKPIAVHLNSSTLKSEKKGTFGHSRFVDTGLIGYDSIDQFFMQVNIFITFMSAMILKTDLVREIRNKEKYVGTYFIQSYIALETMKNQGVYIVNTRNCIAASPNRRVGYDLYYVWGEQYYKLLYNKAVECGVSKKTVEIVYDENMKGIILDFVLSFRITCRESKKWDKQCILKYVENQEDLKKIYETVLSEGIFFVIFTKIKRMICSR